MNGRALAAMLLLALIWGSSFLLIRIAAPVLGPLALVNIRMLVAGTALLLYARVTRQPRPAWRTAGQALLVLGAINGILPLTLEAVAVVQLNASLAAILGTLTPLFTAVVAAVWLHEPLTALRIAGLLLGLLGVTLLVGWTPLALDGAGVLAIGASLLASLLYALAGIYVSVRFRDTPALPLTIGQELAAGVLLLPLALPTIPATVPPPPVLLATLTLALVMTAGGNLLYFSLIRQVGPTKTQSVSFLIPVIGLLGGVLFLGEPLSLSMVLGLAVILLSVVLVTEVPLPGPRRLIARVYQFSAQLRHGALPGYRRRADAGLPLRFIAARTGAERVPQPPRTTATRYTGQRQPMDIEHSELFPC